jgi:5'-methylthioadenosine phosphorylase
MTKVALLGMVGSHKRFADLGAVAGNVQSVGTPFGKSNPIHTFIHEGREFGVLNRFGEDHFTIPPSHVPDKANLWGLKVLGFEKLVSLVSPGSMRDDIKPGHLIIPHDILDEKKEGNDTFFEGKPYGFLRSYPLFCPEIRRAMGEGIQQSGAHYHGKGLYVCTPGPRLETASQVRVYRHHGGDLVGQTLVPEVFLARELELCYASLAYSSYWAEGIAEKAPRPDHFMGGLLDEEEQREVDGLVQSLPEIFLLMLGHLEDCDRECPCPRTMEYYRAKGMIQKDWRTWIK